MSKAQEMARALGLQTADETAPPDRTAKGVKIKWTLLRRSFLRSLGMVSVSVVAPDRPYAVRFGNPGNGPAPAPAGDNLMVWPVRPVNGSVPRDTATTIWDRNPSIPFRTRFRVWFLNERHRDQWLPPVTDHLEKTALGDGSGPMDHGYHDLGPDLRLPVLEKQLHDIAWRLRIPTWSDETLVEWLDGLNDQARQLVAEKGLKISQRLIEDLARQSINSIHWGR